MLTLKLMRNFNETWRAKMTVERSNEDKVREFEAALERASVRRRTKRRSSRGKRKSTSDKNGES